MNIIINIIKWLVNKVNGIGEPKKVETNQGVEVISAIKVKNNPQPIEENKWVLPTQGKRVANDDFTNVNSTRALSNNMGTSGKPGKPGNIQKQPIKIGGKTFDPHTFVEIEVTDHIEFDDYLSDILNGGDNVTPTHDWKNAKKINKKK